MKKVIIIGAGVAGIGAAYRFYCNNTNATIYEQNNYPGGNAASFTRNSFTFDKVPLISFTKNERIRNIFHNSANNKVESIQTRTNSYWKGYWIKHPAQVNLGGLPKDLITRIINEFFESTQKNESIPNNLKEWLYNIFGKTFADTFLLKYIEKYHSTSAENLEILEDKPKFYQPSFNEILFGAISNETKDIDYITDAYYPSDGGFINFTDKLLSKIAVRYNHKVKLIDAKKKFVVFNNGKIEKYDHIISTIPLTELVNKVIGVPYNIRIAADKLAYTSCIIVNISVKKRNISKATQTLFYDNNFIFTRLTFPSLLSAHNSPENCENIQAEIYFSEKYKPLHLPPESFINPTIYGLQKCGILKKEDKIVYKEANLIPYANIIFDFERTSNLEIVHRYLDEIGISYCGRYGDWENWMTDEAFISGENAAQKVMNQIYSTNSFKEEVTKKLSSYLGN